MTSHETEKMFEIAETCVYCRCGCCKDGCPMYSELLEESISPKGRNELIRAVGKGIVEPDERTMRIAYSCLLCKRDEFSCGAEIKNADATEAFRQYLVERGMPLLPEHELLIKNIDNYGNPWGEPKSARKRWAKDFQKRRLVRGGTGTLYYVGCTFSLDRTLQESARAMASLMEASGESYGLLLDEELCCGSTIKRLGHADKYENIRAANAKVLRETGVKRIVTACSGCFKTLKQDYGDLLDGIEILHSTQYLARLVENGRLRPGQLSAKATYHDPCHLGRHAGLYDDPRSILGAIKGLQLIEMKNSRELSRCCGGGAGVKTAYPEISRKAALRRVKEAERTGAQLLVTTCPFCVQTLRAAASESGSKLEVVELSVLLLRTIARKGG